MINVKEAVLGVVLAGGASSRMGGDKSQVMLGGRPMLAHVVERFSPQVARVILNIRKGEPPAGFSLETASDVDGLGGGPLAGVATALRSAKLHGFAFAATVPCDGPFLPRHLVQRLAAALFAGKAVAATARTSASPQPLFALWRTEALGRVEAALKEGVRGPRPLLARLGASEEYFKDETAFANINTPFELADAELWLARDRESGLASEK